MKRITLIVIALMFFPAATLFAQVSTRNERDFGKPNDKIIDINGERCARARRDACHTISGGRHGWSAG